MGCLPLDLQSRSVSSKLFLLAVVLSVLLRYTDSDYPFGIFKLFIIIWKGFCKSLNIPSNITLLVMTLMLIKYPVEWRNFQLLAITLLALAQRNTK